MCSSEPGAVLVNRHLHGAIILLSKVIAGAPKVGHGQPTGPNAARPADTMTFTLQSHEALYCLVREGTRSQSDVCLQKWLFPPHEDKVDFIVQEGNLAFLQYATHSNDVKKKTDVKIEKIQRGALKKQTTKRQFVFFRPTETLLRRTRGRLFAGRSVSMLSSVECFHVFNELSISPD